MGKTEDGALLILEEIIIDGIASDTENADDANNQENAKENNISPQQVILLLFCSRSYRSKCMWI